MLFGSSGIRQQFGAPLTDLAFRVGSAVATMVDTVVAGTDTRSTGPIISHAFVAGALSSGCDVSHGGVAPTPSIALSTPSRAAGCAVTASHNPESYNGIKLINPDGSAFTRDQQAVIGVRIEENHLKDWTQQGVFRSVDLVEPHMNTILSSVSLGSGMTAILDCGNGAGSVITPHLLSMLGVRTICLNCDVSGTFARPSEPLETNIPYIRGMIRSIGAECALIHDGDADRFMAFDERGRYISGDHLLMLFTRFLGARRVVTTVDASMAIEEFAEVQRTPVGDSYVSEALLAWGDFGGEPSGSWIFPRHSLCPDGVYAAAFFCQIASEWNIAEEIDDMPHYPIIRESFEYERPAKILKAMGAEHPTDGVRIEGDEGWCLVRASGTEPKIRITAEGTTREAAQRMADRGRNLLKEAKNDKNVI
jgi:phosphoglucosamine mutase